MPQGADPVVEEFHPTSGTVSGALGLAAVAAFLGAAVVDLGTDVPPWLVVAGLLVAALVWATVLRPRVWATERHLVLRGMVGTVHLPLAAVQDVAVGQVLAVRVGEKRYVSAAIGRRRPRRARPGRRGLAGRQPTPEPSPGDVAEYADLVEDRVRQLAEEARRRCRVPRRSPEQAALAADVRRSWAWPEVATLSVLTLALVVVLVV